MAHILWQQRCLEVASRLHHVGVVDETRRTYRHHGRQRDAPRRIERSATRRCASHHIATQRLSRWGSPAARARLARTVPLKRLWLRDGHVKRNTCERRRKFTVLWRTFQSTRTRRRREQYIPLVAFCLRHFLADFIICMCEFDFRQAHVFVQLARCGSSCQGALRLEFIRRGAGSGRHPSSRSGCSRTCGLCPALQRELTEWLLAEQPET